MNPIHRNRRKLARLLDPHELKRMVNLIFAQTHRYDGLDEHHARSARGGITSAYVRGAYGNSRFGRSLNAKKMAKWRWHPETKPAKAQTQDPLRRKTHGR